LLRGLGAVEAGVEVGDARVLSKVLVKGVSVGESLITSSTK
jgi:hypothetical protein